MGIGDPGSPSLPRLAMSAENVFNAKSDAELNQHMWLENELGPSLCNPGSTTHVEKKGVRKE